MVQLTHDSMCANNSAPLSCSTKWRPNGTLVINEVRARRPHNLGWKLLQHVGNMAAQNGLQPEADRFFVVLCGSQLTGLTINNLLLPSQTGATIHNMEPRMNVW